MSKSHVHNVDAAHARAIRSRVREAIALNRRPGFHFPGYFLRETWPHIGKDDIEVELAPGPHCIDARGEIHLSALGVILDTGLATAPRLAVEPGARMATVNLNARFTGAPAAGNLRMRAQFDGFTAGGAIPQAMSRGVLYANGEPLCHASAAFVLLPPPPHAKLAPLPWQDEPQPPPAPLAAEDMDGSEREIVAASERALAHADAEHAFAERFWDMLPQHTKDGAHCTIALGTHHGNRVRHVQGGLLLAFAAATARAAVPRHPMLCNIAAWYISPGQGRTLTVASSIVHAGRSFAVVKTEIRTAEGALVIEAMSNHAAQR